MPTLEFVCKRNAERSVIAHAVAERYLRLAGLDGKLQVTSSGVLAQEHPSPWGRLEHAVVNYFRTSALAAYGLSYADPPRLTRPREDVDVVLAFEPWIAGRCRERYASRAEPPRITTVDEYAETELPSIEGVQKRRLYRGLIEAMQDAMPAIARRTLEEYPHRF